MDVKIQILIGDLRTMNGYDVHLVLGVIADNELTYIISAYILNEVVFFIIQ